MSRARVYLAGPLHSSGPVEDNVHHAVVVARKLIGHGFAPLVPHLNIHVDPQQDYGHRRWLENDLSWLEVADAVYRLPGDSTGADEEVAYAQERGIPVFYDIKSLGESVSRFRQHQPPPLPIQPEWFNPPNFLEEYGRMGPEEEQELSDNDPFIAMFEGLHADLSGHPPHPSSRRFYELLTEMAETHARAINEYRGNRR
jgi:hypothetical protein